MKKVDVVGKELLRIQKENQGILRAETVIKAARPKRSALHNYFIWDDTKAAHQYRLEQARRLIRVCVVMLGPKGIATRTYVSILDDRKLPGGGYLGINAVMRSPSLREKLLLQAIQDMNKFQGKYKILQELADVFTAMEKVKKKARESKTG